MFINVIFYSFFIFSRVVPGPFENLQQHGWDSRVHYPYQPMNLPILDPAASMYLQVRLLFLMPPFVISNVRGKLESSFDSLLFINFSVLPILWISHHMDIRRKDSPFLLHLFFNHVDTSYLMPRTEERSIMVYDH